MANPKDQKPSSNDKNNRSAQDSNIKTKEEKSKPDNPTKYGDWQVKGRAIDF